VSRQDLASHLRFFQELGVTGVNRDPAWRKRAATHPGGAPSDPEPAAVAPDAGADPARAEPPAPDGEWGTAAGGTIAIARSAHDVLNSVRGDIGDCTRCKLHRLGRRQIVFGVGNPSAELMFVGEAPGADEDIQGVPFVGRAGQLLTKIIEAIGLTRDDVYIANVIKCRPPENRNPEPDEVGECEPFLFQQIDAIAPRVIVALGTFAAKTLLKTQDPISRLRGRVYDYRGAKLIPTFHPAYLLRSPERKRDTWEDMKKVRALLQAPDDSTSAL
jgi:uracil-DNA glycosylase family 4